MKDTVLVAVYGSLLSGLGNHGRMVAAEGELVGETQLDPSFTMVSLGGFPGLIRGGNISPKVEVYRVKNENMPILNRLEGFHGPDDPNNFYNRIEVDTEFGKAFVYTLDDDYRNRPIVESGDWRNYLEVRYK